MPWLYEDLLPTVRRFFALRERLVPYLYAKAEACRLAHEPLIRPVFLLDPAYDPDSDCFLCGSRILACPVFDEGADSVSVTLPHLGRPWRLRDDGPLHAPGEELIVPCRPEDDPVWFVMEG